MHPRVWNPQDGVAVFANLTRRLRERHVGKMVRNTYVSGRQMQGDGGWAQNTAQVYPINEDSGEAEAAIEVSS